MKRLDRKVLTLGLPAIGMVLAVLAVLLLLAGEDGDRSFYEPGADVGDGSPVSAPRVAFDPEGPTTAPPAAEVPSADAPREAEEAPAAAPAKEAEAKDTRPGLLTGEVRDAKGLGVGEATVSIVRADRRRRGRDRFRKTVVTDAAGRWMLEVPPGAYQVRADRDGYARSGREWAEVKPAANVSVDPLVLPVACTLRGLVLSSDGHPLEGARVSLEGRRMQREATADARGAFAIDDLAEGLYTLSARKEGYVSQTEGNVPVIEGGGGEITFQLSSGGVLTGLLRQTDGQPLPKGLVFAFWQGKRLGMTRSDDEGRFRLNNLRPGPVELFARSEDYALTVRTQGSAAAGQLTVQDLVLVEGPRIEGVLRDPEGKPLAGLRVNAREQGGDVNRRSERTGEDGRFVVKNLYPGRYELRVGGNRRWGAARVTLEVEVVAGLREQDITVPTGAAVRGTVIDDAGKPVERANVFAIVGRDYRGSTRTDAKGAFTLESLPEGTYQLFARVGDDRMVGLREVVLRDGANLDEVQLIARPPARLKGRVLDPRGQGVAGVVINVRGGSSPVRRRATTNGDGSFDIGPLYDGDYDLEVAEGPLALIARKWSVARVSVDGFRFQIQAGRSLERDLQVRVSN